MVNQRLLAPRRNGCNQHELSVEKESISNKWPESLLLMEGLSRKNIDQIAFKQPALSPVPIELQVAILFAMQKGLFDAIDTRKVVAAAQSMKEFFATRKDALLTEIRTKAALDKDIEAKLQAACDEWKGSFSA